MNKYLAASGALPASGLGKILYISNVIHIPDLVQMH